MENLFKPGTSVAAYIVFNLTMLALIATVICCYFYLDAFNNYLFLGLAGLATVLLVAVNFIIIEFGLEGDGSGGNDGMKKQEENEKKKVRSLARASLTYATNFPVITLRRKLRQNIREMFFAYRNVNNDVEIQSLVDKGWIHLRTMQKLERLNDSDDTFFNLLSRKFVKK